MRFIKLALAAAVALGTVGTLALPADPAQAQRDWRDGQRWQGRHRCGDGHRHWRIGDRRCRSRYDRRGRGFGSRNRGVCHDVWRNGYRIPVCRY
jgi:hypothetical protein